ncbi:HepT-like ribonuclease domain-containing protein [Leptospira terpstrae]|uniref:Uncharacterized protein n=1 Tax=Leptospira terpstrae serovar Hualin str. LT 11-33 = ATCC 700639 TaxID=1257025 RepID=N1VLY1_9LEPT|nr:hypothetical protein [Leptospira terpstrae]EMY60714.1 hypothetical protein LEP1GSC203_0633 [Leptospira terpstrae serovar Hualin str. LT 11-33 = ATCC 700639]
MFHEFIFYCRELEAFLFRNQIQEFKEGDHDSFFAEEMLRYIQTESLKIPDSEKQKYPNLPWEKIDNLWQKDLARAYDYIDLKMLYYICAYEIPKITKAIKL